MKELIGIGGYLVFMVGLIGAGIYGWIANLLALINMEVWVWSAKSIIGIGGIFVPPVGIIMGLFVW